MTITTREQEGIDAGHELGRVWILDGNSDTWIGLASVVRARRWAKMLRRCSATVIRRWLVTV